MSLRVGTALVALIGLGLFTVSLAMDVSEHVGAADRSAQPRYDVVQPTDAGEEMFADPELQLLVIREVELADEGAAEWYNGSDYFPFEPVHEALPFRAGIEDSRTSQHSPKEAGI